MSKIVLLDPVGDLNDVFVYAMDDEKGEELAEALERLFSYRLIAKKISDSLMDKLSGKPFHAVLKSPPSEFVTNKIEHLQDWVWHHIDGEERHRKRIGSLPEIANPPKFKTEQLLGMRNVVVDWVQRNPIDFALLRDAVKVEKALQRIEVAAGNEARRHKGGRPPIKTEADYLKRLASYEHEVIKLQETKSANEIDCAMIQRNVRIEKDGEKTRWTNGTAKRIIDKFKKWKRRQD